MLCQESQMAELELAMTIQRLATMSFYFLINTYSKLQIFSVQFGECLHLYTAVFSPYI